MKIKSKPEDFLVDELVDITDLVKGPFSLYRLRKRSLNTVETIRSITESLRIPSSAISYGGRKDKHAITTQYIAIKDSPLQKQPFKEKSFSLEFVRSIDRPMGPDLIAGNKFEITIRNLLNNDISSAREEAEKIKLTGVFNYFDDQRFGSYDETQGFLAEKVLKGHYNGAVKIYLAHISSEDKKADKDRKNFFFDNWGRFRECLGKAVTAKEKAAFAVLAKDPKGFLTILHKIPRDEMSLYFSAYQSYLWNDVLRGLIETRADGSEIVVSEGLIGDYLFYEDTDTATLNYFRNLSIPTIASNMKVDDPAVTEAYDEVLKENDLALPMFNIRKLRQAFFKSVQRPALIMPKQFSYEHSGDEINDGRKKMVLRFELPRGSYATMVIKRTFTDQTA